MKNLKKLISVIIAVIMIVGSFATVSAADYKDVESTNSFAKAINVLSGLSIVNGDDEGNFNPKSEIKRSEMVALVCRMMGEEDIANNSASNAFTDVAANHWAAGNIAWGVNRGIVNGMGDGTFAPDASVSYQDAVVMIMRALGYDRIAQRAQNGGYPAGYLKLASQRGILKEAGYDNQAAAPREIVAQLIYNAMTAPLVDVKQYGMNVEDDRYIIHDGSDASAPLRTLLTYTNEIVKVKANVKATAKTSDALIDKEGNYQVKLEVTNAYGYDFDYICTLIGADTYDIVTVYVGETEAADLLGATVEAYMVEDEDLNAWKLLAVVADAKSVKSETITAAKVDFKGYVAGEFTYEDADGNEEEIELATGANLEIYYNGNLVDTADNFGDDEAEPVVTADAAINALLMDAEEITFTGSRTGAYNKIFITDYLYAQVEEVNAEDLYIIADPRTVELDAETRGNKKFVYGLYNAAGEEITLADVAEDDILNIVAPFDVSAAGVVDDDLDAVGYMDIYVTNKVVTGTVTEDFEDGVRYGIDGTTYKVVDDSLTAGDEGEFFLTIDGRIYAYDATSTIAKDFGFLVAAYSEGKYGNTVYENVIRLFTADGKVADFEVAKRLVVDGETKTEAQLSGDAGYINTTLAAKVVEGAEATVKDSVFGRFVTYKLNSDGEIKEISFVGTVNADPGYKYNGNLDRFASKKIGDAKLFIAPVSLKTPACAEEHEHTEECAVAVYFVDDDDLKIASFDAMEHDENYTASVVSLDGKVLSAALLNETLTAAFDGSHLAVVKSVNTVYDAEYDSLTNYTLVQSGETIALKVNPDYSFGLTAGDVIRYTVDADKMIDQVEVIYDMSTTTFNAGVYTVEADDYAIVMGTVTDIEDGVMKLDDNEATMYELLDGEGNTYVSIDLTDGTPDAKDIAVLRSKSNIRETNLRNVYKVISIVTEEGYEDCVMFIENVPAE